jgi:hypothetical protein
MFYAVQYLGSRSAISDVQPISDVQSGFKVIQVSSPSSNFATCSMDTPTLASDYIADYKGSE